MPQTEKNDDAFKYSTELLREIVRIAKYTQRYSKQNDRDEDLHLIGQIDATDDSYWEWPSVCDAIVTKAREVIACRKLRDKGKL